MTVLLATLDELRLHGVDNVLLLLTHRLTQGVALTTGKVGQQTRQQHHLLLINGNAVGILQIFLHHRNIIGDRFFTVLTTYELRNVAHRSRTVQGVHGDEVFKDGGLQLAQVFLHTSRLKLECADGAALLV